MLTLSIISFPVIGFIGFFPSLMVELGGVGNILLYFVIFSFIFSYILFFIYNIWKQRVCKKTYIILSASIIIVFMYSGDVIYNTLGIHDYIKAETFKKDVEEIESYLEECDYIYSLDSQHIYYDTVDYLLQNKNRIIEKHIDYYISKDKNLIIEKHIEDEQYPTYKYNYLVEKSWVDEITRQFLLETENMNNGNSIYYNGYMEYGVCDVGSMNITRYHHSPTMGLFEYIYFDDAYYLSTFTAGSINNEKHFLNDYIADIKQVGGDIYNYKLSARTHRLLIDTIEIGVIQEA